MPSLKAKVERFWRASKRLEIIIQVKLDDFVKDDDAVDAGERNLHVAIEAVIDVGEGLISSAGWRAPRSYRDVVRILREKGVLADEIAKALERAVAIRNVLVHNYVYVMPQDLYRYMSELREPLIKAMKSIIEYIEANKLDP